MEEQAIINILNKNSTTTQKEIAKEINKYLRIAKYYMLQLKEKGFIERENGKRNRKWVVK